MKYRIDKISVYVYLEGFKKVMIIDCIVAICFIIKTNFV